ncbi:MAG: hypothetical protein OEZ68_05115 [Gammaproteobacteria bacterium]|nr:hypothetical protein [Gammaproteobacteria bacterium]MDH5800169.1 hypothetical protein [Gammaproteobacteria bacterium]
MKTVFLILCSLTLCSCTAVLIHEADSDKRLQKVDPGSTIVLDAYEKDGSAYICIRQTKVSEDYSKHARFDYVLRVPLPSNPDMRFTYHSDSDYPSYRATKKDVVQQSCVPSGEKLSMLQVTSSETVVLPEDSNHAIYVRYATKTNEAPVLLALGYVGKEAITVKHRISARQINVHQYNIDLTYSGLFDHPRSAKPILKLLAPITVAVDVALTAVVLTVLSYFHW